MRRHFDLPGFPPHRSVNAAVHLAPKSALIASQPLPCELWSKGHFKKLMIVF